MSLPIHGGGRKYPERGEFVSRFISGLEGNFGSWSTLDSWYWYVRYVPFIIIITDAPLAGVAHGPTVILTRLYVFSHLGYL